MADTYLFNTASRKFKIPEAWQSKVVEALQHGADKEIIIKMYEYLEKDCGFKYTYTEQQDGETLPQWGERIFYGWCKALIFMLLKHKDTGRLLNDVSLLTPIDHGVDETVLEIGA